MRRSKDSDDSDNSSNSRKRVKDYVQSMEVGVKADYSRDEPDYVPEAQIKKMRREGILTIIGGILLLAFNGCFFLWANISVYVLSYFYITDKTINQNAIFYIDFLLVLLNVTGYQFGTYLLNKRNWHPKAVLALGGSISLLGITIASFVNDFWSFVFFYGVISAIGCGMNYFIPLVCAWDYFPNRKGLTTGILESAYGAGSFLWTQIAKAIVNPENEAADVETGIKDLTYFREEIASRVPKMFRYLVCVWLVQVFIAIVLINRPKSSMRRNQKLQEQQNQTQEAFELAANPSSRTQPDLLPNIDPDTRVINREYNLVSVKAAFRSVRFWQYLIMMFGANIFGTFFSYEYKPFGLANGLKDSFLTWAGSFSSLTQVLARFTVGSLYDYLGFRIIFFVLIVINIANSLICYWAVKYDWLYFICIQLNYLVIGGVFSLFPAPASKTFGTSNGVRIYALILYSSVLASGLDTLLVKLLYDQIHLQGLIWIGAAFNIIILIVNFTFNERLDIERLDEKGLIVWGRFNKEDDQAH